MDELVAEVLAEVVRADEKHGPLNHGLPSVLASSRLSVACLEDELEECLQAWREDRRTPGMPHLREELIQVAALAMRAVRDLR